MQRLNADLALLLAATIWGVAFLFQKSATSHIGPLTFIAARCALAAVALAPFAWHEGRSTSAPAERRFPAIALWGGLAFFIAAWLQQAGLATATVTNTGFLTALYVVIIPLLRLGLEREGAERGRVAGDRPFCARHLAARRRHARGLLGG